MTSTSTPSLPRTILDMVVLPIHGRATIRKRMALALHYLTLAVATAVAAWTPFAASADASQIGWMGAGLILVLMLLLLDVLWRAELVDWN